MRLRLRRCRLGLAMLAVALLSPLAAGAQDVTTAALKAAFIFNFVRFTEWPAPVSVADPFVICVAGDPAVGDALQRIVQGRDLEGRRINVSLLAITGTKDTCRVLYLSGTTANETMRVVAELQNAPILTISDVAGFTEAGGMAQFFFDSGRLRFRINVAAVKRSRLQISSKLLLLAQRYE